MNLRPTGRRVAHVALAVTLITLVSCEAGSGDGDGQTDDGANGGSGLPPVVLSAEEQAGYDSLMAQLLGGDGVSGAIGSYWPQAYSGMVIGSLYRAPAGVKAYEGAAQPSGCGLLSTENAWYCSNDSTVYYDDNFLRFFYHGFGAAAPATILAHEWGHHVQALMGTPQTSIAAELQADCLAGMFSGVAFLPPEGEEDLRWAAATLFTLADKDYSAVKWFAPGVHGPASWRAKAFLDGTLGEGAYCVDYRDWEERGTVPVGSYRWLPAPGIEVTQGDDGSVTATLRGRTAFIQAPASPVSVSALEYMPTASATYLGADATPIGPAAEIETGDGTSGILGGTGAVQAFQFSDASGGLQHGILFLHVATTGHTALTAVIEPGPPPAAPLSDEAWNPLLNWMFVVGFSLCPPDGAGTMCLALGDA